MAIAPVVAPGFHAREIKDVIQQEEQGIGRTAQGG
jgi:hypothetical protein